MEIEDVAHALYKCTHASRLWNEMRKVWSLPSHVDLQHHPSMWLQSVILNIPDHMIDTTLLVSWRAWYCRNEATHNKPLPQVKSSKRFLCSYWSLLRNIKTLPMEEVIKGKSIQFQSTVKEQATIKDKPPDKPWNRPPPGTVKLSVDGSFHAGDHTAGMGMVMRDDQGNTIFTACRFLEQCDRHF
jgi:hypothetical protein